MSKAKKPLFAKFLEKQIKEEELKTVVGGADTASTEERDPVKIGDQTMKYPSDSDEDVTMKYPSDNDEW